MTKENKDLNQEDDENLMKAITAVVKMSGTLKENWNKTFGGGRNLTNIAKNLISLQELPPGATPTYERDIDVANIVTQDDLGFKEWVGPSEGLKGHQEIEEENMVKHLENWVAPELPPGNMPINNDDPDSPPPNKNWIQTFTGRRFDPIDPVEGAIVIGDIAHSLSNQCRFTGHVKKFYSVAQHCVLVSYICDEKDALHGLLHDASEAYLVDVPRPLKRSGKFDAYLEMENHLQTMIYRRFDLEVEEPAGVKRADTILLATEARDLMAPLHKDWAQPIAPLPFKIVPLSPEEAKDLFIKRFHELNDIRGAYDHL